MALFSKPPLKKAEFAKAAVKPRPDAQRGQGEQGAAGSAPKRKQDPASILGWQPSRSSIEVGEATPGLPRVLENAALLFASGQEIPARAMLEESLEADPEAKASPLAWHALFDLLQRAGDKAAFDQLALQYVVRFEQLAPTWTSRAKPQIGPRHSAGGQISLTGKLTAASATPLEALKRAVAKQQPNVRVHCAGLTGFDDAGARLLAAALALARTSRVPLLLQHVDALDKLVAAALQKGRDAGEGAWTLALELLQWKQDRDAFEERAIDFAVTFEQSPPSWEPPAKPESPEPGAAAAAPQPGAGEGDRADDDVLRWSGAMTGSHAPQLAQLAELADRLGEVTVDMSGVERIDWVCAGTILNAITRIEAQHKFVHLAGATPIIRALLLLIGIPQQQFVRKVP